MRPNLQSTRTIAEECVNEYKKLWKRVENAEDETERRKADLKNKRKKVREKAERFF
jgi:hypothetical protein